MHQLIYTNKEGQFQRVTLEETLTIGRNPNQSLQILDLVVSKSHATIEWSEEGYYVLYDNQSRNGTYVNAIRVDCPVRLTHGDKIQIGNTLFYFSNGSMPPECCAGKDRTVRLERFEELSEHHANRAVIDHKSDTFRCDQFLPVDQIQDEENLRSAYERLRVAFELTRSICLGAHSETRERILNLIVDEIMENTNADRALILLEEKIDRLTHHDASNPPVRHFIDFTGDPLSNFFSDANANTEEGKRFNLVAYRDREVVYMAGKPFKLNISRTIFNQVLTERRHVLSTNLPEDQRFANSDSIVCSGLGATMTVPLLRSDETVLGVIHLDSTRALGVFDETDLAVIIVLAQQVTLLLEHLLLLRKMEKEILTRKSLSRLLSPRVVEKVINGDLLLETKSQSCYVTVMFVDIRGFTEMSESLRPDDLVEQLNQYFGVMTRVIFEYDGMVDKVIGDEIMAVWGVPFPNDKGEFQAVACAIKMLEALAAHNRTRQNNGLRPIEVGIGINSGMVIAGYMGNMQSTDYTVTGDTVNVAARICEKAREERILVGYSTWEKVKGRFKGYLFSDNQIRGRSERVEIYSIIPEPLTERRQLEYC